MDSLTGTVLYDLAAEAVSLPAEQLAASTEELQNDTQERLANLTNALQAISKKVTYSPQGLSPILLPDLAVFALSRLGLGMAYTTKDCELSGFYSVLNIEGRFHPVLIGLTGLHTEPPQDADTILYFDWDDIHHASLLTEQPHVLELVNVVEAAIEDRSRNVERAIVWNCKEERPELAKVDACGEWITSKIANCLLAGFEY